MKSNKSIIIFYFILIIFYLIFYINCETCTSCTSNKFSCSGSDCPSNCKPNYQGTQCYDCQEFPNYYSIVSSSCNQCTGNKIIFESKECVDSCNSPMYIMSDACYRNCPEYSMIDGNLCKCLYNYYFTTVTTTNSPSTELKIQHCLPPNIVPNGYNFYNMDGEFLKDSCGPTSPPPSSPYYLKNEIIGGKSVTRCSSGCIGNEFEYENDGKKYCLDSCPSGTKTFNNFDNRKCLSSSDKCSDVNPNFYEKNNICVDKNECIVYYNEKCYNYCSEIGENYHKIYDSKECVEGCPPTSTYKYLKEDENICFDLEHCPFISHDDTKCLFSCNIGQGFYKEGDKHCYSSCISSSNQYFNVGTNKCILDCNISGNNNKYHKQGGFECFYSCKDIGDGTFIYETDNVCSATSCSLYYIKEDGIRKCISSDNICITMGKIYKKGNECLGICNGYKKGDTTSGQLIECFESLDECFRNGHIYYNKELKKCFQTYPSDNNYIKSNNNGRYELISECPNFYYEDNSKKYCIDSCIEVRKFFINGQKECIGSCPTTPVTINGNSIIRNNYYPPTNECVSTCFGKEGYEFTIDGHSSPNPCQSDCPNGKFYFADNKVIKSNCGDKFISSSNPKLCVESCEKYIENDDNIKQCVENCDGYFYEKDSNNNYKCVRECTSTGHHFNIKTRECLEETTCSESYYEVGNFCYPKCTGNNKYINPHTFECSNICPIGYEKFEKITDEDIYICKNSCPQYILNNECTEICPETHNYIGYNRECKPTCNGDLLGPYYKIKESISSSSHDYNIYECINSCDGLLKVQNYNENSFEGMNQCYDSCPEYFPYKSEEENICYNICLNSKINPFTLYNGSEKKCTKKCDGVYKYYGEDKICRDNCDNLVNKIKNYNGECVSQCDPNSEYKFNDNGECKNECSGTNLRYSRSNYICKPKCIPPEEYLKENENECISSCQSFEFKKKIYTTEGIENTFTGEYRCVSSFGEKKYYFNNKILIDNCYNNDYVVFDTNECVENCESISIKSSTEKYYYYEASEGSSYTVNTCVKNCKSTDKKFLRENNHCSDECDQNGYKYYKENDYICIKDCPIGYISNQHKCVQKCQGDNKFFYKDENGESCLPNCPDDNKYYVKTDEIKTCLHDCPKESPFYIIIPNIGGTVVNLYECKGECENNYLVDIDKNVNAKFCHTNNDCIITILGQTTTYFSRENGKECYSRCPEGNYTLEEEIDGVSVKKCYDKCPTGYYHKKNEYICLKAIDCPDKTIDYDTGLCVETCENKNEGKLPLNSQEIKVCLNTCIEIYGKYETPDKKCVPDCQSYSAISNLKNGDNGKCTCNSLFYYDNPSIIKCLPEEITNCQDNTVDSNYKINLVGTNQCLSTCNYIISLNKEYCYTDASTACYHNLHSVVNGKECYCPNKYQIIDGKKKCYAKEDVCPTKLYVPEKKECVNSESCPADFPYKFQDRICLKSCPYNSITTDQKECLCGNENNGLWIEKSDGNYECLKGRCPDTYPVYSVESKQCLKTCKETNYPILFENKCYSKCEDTGISYLSEREITNNNLGTKTCACDNPWYYENNKIECPNPNDPENIIKSCSDYNENNKHFKYMIYDTKECVELCPSDKPFNFNNECFNSCKSANEIYHNVKQVGSSYDCQCANLWYFQTYNNKIICLNENINECSDFEDEEFDGNYKYEIYKTKECVKVNVPKCPDNLYNFNYVCYETCPENTKDNESENKDCSCNIKKGYWYEYEKKGQKYLKCGLKDCLDIRMYLLESESKCVKDCNENENNFKWTFRNICVENCPPIYTKKDEENKKCLFYDLDDEEVNNLINLKNYANIQAKELYEKAAAFGGIHLGGYLFNKFDASLQVYAINKEDTLKELATKSNLTYIDFNTCLPKIYADNSIRDEDKIIVVKYDLIQWNLKEVSSGTELDKQSENEENEENKYLINRVEYEFFNSRTMEKIDASVCDPYEIIISYPIFFNKNKYNDYETGFNNNEYMKKFQIGKELFHKNNEVDTFNFNNSVYKDICMGIEIDGKDLVLEDRYEYLYPNGALLCESNCTINNTNFEEERINCKCSYKEIFDFYRKENEKNDLLNDPNFSKPGQSSANLEIIKCLSKLSLKQAIVNNEAFYYCAAVTLAITSMVFVTTFHGVKIVSGNIGNILNKFGSNNINNLDINIKNENPIGTSNRAFNNPPKRTENNIRTDNDENIVEIKNTAINKNINNNLEYDENNFNDSRNINLGSNNLINDIKAEYLPSQYNFKYFKLTDKGIIKKIERNNLPFKVKPETKYLIERKNNINYPKNYLNGPFLQNQNILEIIDDSTNDNKNTIKYSSNPNKNLIGSNDNNNNSNNTIEDDNNINNDDNGIVPYKKKGNSNLNINIKSERNDLLESKEKDFITIKKIKSNYKPKENNIIVEEYEEEKEIKKEEDNSGLYTSIKKEQSLLRISYEKYLIKHHPNILSRFLAEILDKVYLVKICIFLKKFEIFGMHLSLYLFCHLLLLTLLCAFFTIKTIKKIWTQKNYPNTQFYLLYGLLSNIIIWAIYKIFLCLIDIQDKVLELVKLKNEPKNNEKIIVFEKEINREENNALIEEKYKSLMKNFKFRIIIFYIIIFVFTIFCFIYLVSFFGIYTGTKGYVFMAYLISIIEILLIKLVYGICLASLRIASEGNRLKWLYKVVYVFDKYIS